MKKSIISCVIGSIMLGIGVYRFITSLSEDSLGKILIFIGGIIAVLAYINIGKLLKLKGYFIGQVMNIIVGYVCYYYDWYNNTYKYILIKIVFKYSHKEIIIIRLNK